MCLQDKQAGKRAWEKEGRERVTLVIVGFLGRTCKAEGTRLAVGKLPE